MKLHTIKLRVVFLITLAFVMLSFVSKTFASTHGMSPRDGYVTTSTGAPVPYIKVTESTDTCPPVQAWQDWHASGHITCPYPYDPSLAGTSNSQCHVERSVRTDQNGYYFFPAWWPSTYNRCDPNIDVRYTCSNPSVFIGAVADNPLSLDIPQLQNNNNFLTDITHSFVTKVYAQANVCPPPVQHPTNNISDAITTPITCNPPPQHPPACGVSCFKNDDCAGARDGCTICVGAVIGDPENGQWTGSTPGRCAAAPTPTPTPLPACGSPCTTPASCANALNGCTFCLTNAAGQNVCSPLPACGTACSDDRQCVGARNGCTQCVAGACHTVVACGTACTTRADCQAARDGCTECMESASGQNVCSPVPACGTSCTKDSQCAGARNGCNFCSGGKCSAFSEDMCSCDGMDFSGPSGNETFFPGDNVNFIAYGVVPGNKWKGSPNAAVSAAQVTSMTFYLYQSSLTDPNKSTLIANSAAITPVVVQNDPNKVRYKVTWDRKIPTSVPAGTLFRIQAKVACSAKPGVLGAKTQAVGAENYFSQLYDVVSSLFARGSASVLGTSTTQNQHADTFFPGAKIQEKSCDIIKFFFE